MARKKISELTAADELTGDELVPVVQGGTTKRTTLQEVADLGGGSGGGLTLVEQVNSYEFVLEDANTGIVNPSLNGANAYFVPAEADVDYPIGTFLVVKNADPFKTVTVTIENDFFEDPITGSTVTTFTINPLGIVTLLKHTSALWTIIGAGYEA